MVMIAHESLSELVAYAALRQVPAASLPGVADGAFLFIYQSSPPIAIYGYYRPEDIHAFADMPAYQLTVVRGEARDCDCPAKTYDGKPGPCKHMHEYNAQAADHIQPAPAGSTRMNAAKRAAIRKMIDEDYD